MARDLDGNPWSDDEQFVSDYFQELTGGVVGSGEYPIRNLVAQHGILYEIVKRTYGSVLQGMIVTGITEPVDSAQQITVPARRRP